MLNKLNSLLTGRVSVFKNFLALGILQGTNFIIPLLIMPYLVIHIGYESYGVVSFVQAIMVYFYSITDYGFLVSATRELATSENNEEGIASIFNRVFFTKLFLLFISGTLLTLIVFLVPDFKEIAYVFLLGFSIVVGQTILPVWFFQGVEKMKYITILNLLAKLIFTAFIFVFVKEEKDYPLVLLFFGLGNIISGIVGLVLAIRQYKIEISVPSARDIGDELKKSWEIFLANFSIASYMNSNIFILGLFASNLLLGYYSVAEKIIFAMRQVLVIFSQAIYPHLCKLAQEGHSKVKLFFKQLFVPFSIVYLVVSFWIYIFAEEVVYLFSHSKQSETVFLLRALVFVPSIVMLNIPSYQTLLANNFQKSCSIILIIGSILNILLNLALVPDLKASGTVVSVIITEVFITLGLNIILRVRHPQIKLI